MHEVQALQQQLADSQALSKRQQHQISTLQQQQQLGKQMPSALPSRPQMAMSGSTSGNGVMDATDIDSPRPASTGGS